MKQVQGKKSVHSGHRLAGGCPACLLLLHHNLRLPTSINASPPDQADYGGGFRLRKKCPNHVWLWPGDGRGRTSSYPRRSLCILCICPLYRLQGTKVFLSRLTLARWLTSDKLHSGGILICRGAAIYDFQTSRKKQFCNFATLL